ncbi:hypothetical protein KAR91_26110 [Candidatus Pacearchaeota archaeon]|nr:hypothetical protein [Candidatus Pacearchaeota archaeon]
MADFYSRMQSTSNKLLLGKGQAVTLTKVVPGVYDPATGAVINTETTQTGTGAVVDWNDNQIDGTLIKTGDKLLLLSPLNTAGAALTAPEIGDKITDAASVVYTLVGPLSTISPAGTPVLYKCNMRA